MFGTRQAGKGVTSASTMGFAATALAWAFAASSVHAEVATKDGDLAIVGGTLIDECGARAN